MLFYLLKTQADVGRTRDEDSYEEGLTGNVPRSCTYRFLRRSPPTPPLFLSYCKLERIKRCANTECKMQITVQKYHTYI